MITNFLKVAKSVCITIFLIVYSCQTGQNISGQLDGKYFIDLDMSEQLEIRTSDIFKYVKTIILETSDECIIGRVSEMQIFDMKIYILDRIGRSLLVFDMEGRFIRRIGRLGRGPGEYASILDFTIDTANKRIFISDGRRIHKYTVDGLHIKSVQIEGSIWFSYIQYFDGIIFAANRNPKEDEKLLYTISSDTGEILDGYFTLADNNMGWNGWAPDMVFFNRLHGTPKYTRIFMNTIWSLDNMSPYITFPDENLPTKLQLEEIKRLDIIDQLPKIQILPKTSSITNYVESENLIIFLYSKQLNNRHLLYKKDDKKFYAANPFINDLVHNKSFPLNVKCRDESGAYYEVIEMEQFFLYKEHLIENLDKLEHLLALDIEANPVIFFYEFKYE